VLLSSHRLEEIEALQSHAVLLDRGRIRYSGDLEELRRRWERPFLEVVLGSEDAAMRLAADLVGTGVATTVHATAIRCRLPADLAVGELLAGLGSRIGDIHAVREIPMPLRDLIARVYAPENRDRSEV
jgi:ABC-2 type transport system ATP-binding protein